MNNSGKSSKNEMNESSQNKEVTADKNDGEINFDHNSSHAGEIKEQNLIFQSDLLVVSNSRIEDADNKKTITPVVSNDSNSSAEQMTDLNESNGLVNDLIEIKKIDKKPSSDTLPNDSIFDNKNNSATNLKCQSQTVSSNTYKALSGQPVKLIEIDQNTKQIVFFENELKEIFDQNKAQDKLICVCSIAGDYRKGKSFLLNYCLRFLMNNQEFLNKETRQINPVWFGNADEPLSGFSWRSGVDLETTGVWIWSKMFPCKIPKSNFNILRTGSSNLDSLVRPKGQLDTEQPEKEAYDDALICLIDSQGVFDEKSTISDCAMIFSILFLTSSMQIYNVFHQLQEDNLHYLQLFTEYGRLIFEEGIHCKPFQRLTFLIRDWFSPSQYEFGNEGGEDYLTRKFQIENFVDQETTAAARKPKVNSNLKENLSARRHIQRCFEKIDCFLLPHPGKSVASSNNYNGNWGDMQSEFHLKLKEFVEWWFTDLQVKRSTDYLPHKLTGSEFISFFKTLIFKLSEHNDENLKPITLFDSMSKISHLYAIEDSAKQYQIKMDTLFGSSRPFVWPQNIEKISKYLEKQTKSDYLKRKKFGNRQFEGEFMAELESRFKKTRDHYVKMNQLKCIVLPAYLLIICTLVFTHIFASTFRIFFTCWLLVKVIDLLYDIQLFFLFWALSVELFGFRYGFSVIAFLRTRLQCIHHITRAKKIDLSILNHLK